MSTGAAPFSLVLGGPFHDLLGRLRLVGADRLPTRRTALLLALLAWLPAAALAVADYLFHGNPGALSYFQDYIAYIRCLVAIPIVVVTERAAHRRLTPVTDQFLTAGLIDQRSMPAFQAALARADRLSGSRWVEGALVIVVMVLAVLGANLDIELGGFDWDGRVEDGVVVYTWAGVWSHWVVKPFFQFLVLRWFWRFAVWGWLLYRISRLKLNLIAFHPDQTGGLGFLTVYPMVFGGLIFSLSAALAAQLVSEVYATGVPQHLLWSLLVAWVAFVVAVFVGPLAVFVRPLYNLREQAIFELSRLAGEHQRAFTRKWLDGSMRGDDLLGSADVSSASDLGPIGASPYTMRTLPFTWPMLAHLALTAGVPMLAVAATQMPLSELLGLLASVL